MKTWLRTISLQPLTLETGKREAAGCAISYDWLYCVLIGSYGYREPTKRWSSQKPKQIFPMFWSDLSQRVSKIVVDDSAKECTFPKAASRQFLLLMGRQARSEPAKALQHLCSRRYLVIIATQYTIEEGADRWDHILNDLRQRQSHRGCLLASRKDSP